MRGTSSPLLQKLGRRWWSPLGFAGWQPPVQLGGREGRSVARGDGQEPGGSSVPPALHFWGSAPAPFSQSVTSASPPRDESMPRGHSLWEISFQAQKGGRYPQAEHPAPLGAHNKGHPPPQRLCGGNRGAVPPPGSWSGYSQSGWQTAEEIGPVARGCRAQSLPATACPCPPGGMPAVRPLRLAGGGCGNREGAEGRRAAQGLR